MKDNDIIKALECCLKLSVKVCPECPYYRKEDCSSTLIQDTLNLINRQKAEIERLNGCVKTEDEVRAIAAETIKTSINIIKAEAVKEFAEELIKQLSTELDEYYGEIVWVDDIDNLVKEMVGED